MVRNLPRVNARGNILFLILLAVVLFAALSYAVTSSMRGGGKDASSENARAYAADLIQYGTLIEQSVQRMMLTDDVRLNQLDFSSPTTGVTIIGSNSNCTVPACRVFHPTGAAVTPRLPASAAYYPRSRKFLSVALVQIANVGTELDDLVIAFSDINEATCLEINNILGIANNNNGKPPNNTWDPKVSWSGNMATYTEATADTITDPALVGKTSFCARQAFSLNAAGGAVAEGAYGVTSGNLPMYYYIHTIVAR